MDMELSQLISKYMVDSMLILIPFLMVVGYIIKHTNRISDELIPVILIIIGIIGGIGIGGLSIDSVIQGSLACGGAVMSNQVYKQITKNKY